MREGEPTMKSITEADVRLAFPEDLRYLERLDQRQRTSYLALCTVYRRLLNAYVAFMGLGKYDIALRHNERPVAPVPPAEQDLYQRYAYAGLAYFYVRNNTYVERLTADELGFLRERVRERNLTLDLDSFRFVEDTFEKVIREQWVETDEAGSERWSNDDVELHFGPEEERFLCPNGALVVGCRVAERQTREAMEDVLDCIELLRASLAERLSVPVAVVRYDAASVRVPG